MGIGPPDAPQVGESHCWIRISCGVRDGGWPGGVPAFPPPRAKMPSKRGQQPPQEQVLLHCLPACMSVCLSVSRGNKGLALPVSGVWGSRDTSPPVPAPAFLTSFFTSAISSSVSGRTGVGAVTDTPESAMAATSRSAAASEGG